MVPKIWPGPLPAALPIVTENQAIIEPIQQVWTWSNWGSEKQAAARWFACYGDMFLKVATKSDDAGKPVRGPSFRIWSRSMSPTSTLMSVAT